MEIPILYEDNNCVVINKPAGLLVHPDGRSNDKTLADWITEKYPDLLHVGEPFFSGDGKEIIRPGIVHRIDRDTSGVLVLAKTAAAYLFLKRQFAKGLVQKVYRAFVYGELKKDDGSIDKPIGRSRRDFRQWTAILNSRREASRESLTHYLVIGRAPGFTFLELRPKTGRTHQIRVHLKAIGHPVVCDRLYASKEPPAFGFSRPALHALRISFRTIAGDEASVLAPYPQDFLSAIEEFKKIGFLAKEALV